MEKSNNINKIIDHLQYSSHQYQFLKFDLWMAYCEVYSSGDEQFQSLLANSALFHWWNNQYYVLEAQFLEDIESYVANSDTKHLRDLYDSKMATIALYYSKPLIKKAIKQNLTPELN